MMLQSRKIMLAFMLVLLAAGLSLAEPAIPRDAAGAAGTAAEIRKLTGARTRIVWIQDAAPDAPCVFAERPTLRLMGFDSDDPAGEHAILPAVGSYVKPLITADGKQIVFGNKVDREIYAVNWDGTGLKAIVNGADFEDVWTDPRDGVTWVYGKLLEKRAGKDVPVIRRYRVDDSRVNELIWDKLDVYQFQVSGDGKAACGGGEGGNSMQGMLTLPNGAFHGFAGGCCPSMSPDASHRTWVFRGHHRGIYVFLPDPQTGKASGVPCEFEGAPGVPAQGHEMYHPRWSNNTRFMTMTGPYLYSAWRWQDDVKLTGEAAAGVEIYIGKFADDFQSMAGWVKVSHNKLGDYWPDAWIEPRKGEPAAAPQEAAPAQQAAPAKSAPPSTEGLVFEWTNAASASQVIDPKTQAIRLCTGQFRDLARLARHGLMDLAGGAFVVDNADADLLAACRKSGELGIEATITPAHVDQADAAVITFSSGGSRNFTLAQVDQWLVLRLRTSATGPNGSEVPLCTLAAGRPTHVVISYSGRRPTGASLLVTVDGRRALIENRLRADFANWAEQHLLFGDDWDRGHNWAGTLEGVAIYGRSIGAAEARARYAACLARMKDRKPAERLVLQGKLVQASKAPDPKSIKPYRRYLSVALYDVEKVLDGKCDARRVQVAHWSIMDAKPLKSYEALAPGASCKLVLEPFKDHPEQESERREMEDVELPLYLDVAEAPQPPAAAPRDVQWLGDKGGSWDTAAGWAGAAKPEFRDNAILGGVTAGTRTITIDSPATIGKLTMAQPTKGAKNVLTLNNALTVRGSAAPFAMSSADPSGVMMNVNGAPLSIVNSTLDDVTLAGAVRLAGKGEVRAVAVLKSGGGYGAAPAVSFEGGGGNGAAAEATMSVAHLALTKLGGGYTTAPTVVISPPEIAGGAQAAATAKIDANGALAELRVTDPGSGYVKAPTITFTGGGGKGAAAEAALCVSAVCVTVPGSGYATPPTVKFTGGDGRGAVAEAALQRTLLQYTEQNGAVKLTNKGSLTQDGAAIFLDWAAPVHNGAPGRNFHNAGQWALRNGSAIRFISSTRRPIWAGGGCTNSGTMRIDNGSSVGFRDFTNTGVLELGASVTLSEPIFAESDIVLNNGANGKIIVTGSTAARPAVLGTINDFNNGSRTLNNGTTGAAGATLHVGTGNDAAVFELRGGNVYLENFPACIVDIRAGATLCLRTNDAGSRHMFVNRNARFTNRGAAALAGRIQLGGNHSGDELIANYGTLSLSGGASCERLKASAGDGAFYSAEENPTRLTNYPGAVLAGAGRFTYVNSTGSDLMRALKLTNLGMIKPGDNRIGNLQLVNMNVIFGSAQAPQKPDALALAKGGGTLRIEIGGPADDPAKFDALSLTGGTLTLVEGAGNTLHIVTLSDRTPSGTYRIVSHAGGTGKFDVLRFNNTDKPPFTVNYLKDGIEVVFPGAAK